MPFMVEARSRCKPKEWDLSKFASNVGKTASTGHGIDHKVAAGFVFYKRICRKLFLNIVAQA
jgi:hypothetical protein